MQYLDNLRVWTFVYFNNNSVFVDWYLAIPVKNGRAVWPEWYPNRSYCLTFQEIIWFLSAHIFFHPSCNNLEHFNSQLSTFFWKTVKYYKENKEFVRVFWQVYDGWITIWSPQIPRNGKGLANSLFHWQVLDTILKALVLPLQNDDIFMRVSLFVCLSVSRVCLSCRHIVTQTRFP